MPTKIDRTKADLIKAADQCVMCGMCLPHCPTYQVSRNEAESPRGRISLIKAFAENKLQASTSLEQHIQSCTGCLSCQQICPAKVNYQDILDSGKTLYRSELSLMTRTAHKLAINMSTHALGHKTLRLAKHFKRVLPTNRYTELLNHLDYQVIEPEIADKNPTHVCIFTGCTGNVFDTQTLNSLIQILDAIGVKASLTTNTLCCGAISQHSGLPEKANDSINQLKKYLAAKNVNTLLSFASGCGRQLNEQLTDNSVRHIDALTWLCEQPSFQKSTYASTNKKVLVHSPCTLQNETRQITHNALKKIPNIELLEFNDNLDCCGAGGIQLTSPEQSNELLLESKINSINNIKPDMIVSSNIGCALNFKLGLDNTNLDIEVIHPLTLLARQLTQ